MSSDGKYEKSVGLGRERKGIVLPSFDHRSHGHQMSSPNLSPARVPNVQCTGVEANMRVETRNHFYAHHRS